MSDVDASAVMQALRARFADPERYAVLPQVNAGTGLFRKTWIDALVISFWPSDGLRRAAIEIKVDRQDFLREVRSPRKNEAFRSLCHEFWFATGPDVVADAAEVPENAGWYLLRGSKLICKRQARINTTPCLDDGFLAAVTRAVIEEQKAALGRTRDAIVAGDREIQHWKLFALTAMDVISHRDHEIYAAREEADIRSRVARFGEGLDRTEERARIEEQLGFLRDVVARFLETVSPAAVALLHETDLRGRAVLSHYGNDLWELLADIVRDIQLARAGKREWAAKHDERRLAGLRALMNEDGGIEP